MRAASLFLFFFVLGVGNGIVAQDRSGSIGGLVPSRWVSDRVYSDVLDSVFPRSVENKKNTLWQMVLRFEPSFGSESQIVIRRTFDGFEVNRYRSANGVIFNKLNVWFTKNGREDVPEMSRLVQVERRKIRCRQSDLEDWLNGFFRSIPVATRSLKSNITESGRTGTWSVPVHGGYYQVWFSYKGNEMNFVANDENISDINVTGTSPIVRWMNSVRIQIEKSK